MRKAIWLATAAASVLAAAPVCAQQTPPPAPNAAAQAPVQTGPVTQAPAVDAAQQGVLVFEPAFFAGSNPNTALDMIARLPGFGLDTGDNQTRGFAGAAGNVLIDGDRPSSKSDTLDQILQRISADSVERIELIRGGAPGIDMQGRSVVANVVVKQSVQIERVVELNSYIYPDGALGPLLKASYSRREGDNQIEGAVSATNDRTDATGTGYRRRYDAAGDPIQIADLDLWDRIQFVDARGSVQRRVGGGKLKVNGLLRYENFDRTIDTRIVSGAGPDEFSSEEYDGYSGELGGNWSRPFGARTELELTGLQRWSNEQYTSGFASDGFESTFGNDATSGESIGRAVVRFRQNERWSFETGGEAAYNFLDSESDYAEDGVSIPLPSDAVKVEELRGEAFGQTTWRPSPKLTVEAGLRVEVSKISQSGDIDLSKSFVYPKPRLQVTWTPAEGHQLRFRAEREVGQLDFGDFVASAEVDIGQVDGGNPDLEPSKSTTYEAVYERRFWGEGALVLTGQYSQVEDVVDIIPLQGGFDAVGNIGEGRSLFFESRLTLPLDKLGVPHGRLQGRIGLSDTEVTDPLTGEKRRFQGNAPFTCGLAYTQDLRGGRWSYGFDTGCSTVESSQFRTRELREFENEPFTNLFVQWKPKEDLTVRVDLGNAGDREARRTRFVYAGPRNTAPLLFREDRGTKMAPWLFLQIRKTL